MVPLTVCEILRDLAATQGKTVAVLGRYSFRESSGSWVGEQVCDPAVAAHRRNCGWWKTPRTARSPPSILSSMPPSLRRKLLEMGRHTTLGKFRFGTSDYDRWAVIYGRLEPHKPDEKKAAANLVYRGDGVVVFVKMDQ